MILHNIVIIGTSHHNAYSMVRCFGEAGMKPDVIIYGTNDSYILKSKYIKRKFFAGNACEAMSLLKEKYDEGIIISCTDEAASILDENYNELKNKYIFFNCGAEGKLTNYMDKSVQIEKAKNSGLLTPKSYVGFPTEIVDCKESISYPVIIKPLESIHGGKKIRICNDRKSYEQALKDFDPQSKVLAQEFISKESEIVILGVSMSNELIIPGYVLKYRDTLGGTTYARVNPISDLPARLVSSCEKLVNSMAYEGLFGIEMIKSGDDYYFIEINLRNDATTYALAKAGCNLPLVYYNKLTGRNDVNNLSPVRSINFMVELNDIIHVFKREVSFWTWLKQLKGSQCKYCYCKTDKNAFWPQLGAFMKFLIQMVKTHGIHKYNKDKIASLFLGYCLWAL